MPIPLTNPRTIQDALFVGTAFALPAAASSTTSQATPAGFDLGTDPYKAEEFDFVINIPALSTTIVPDTRTVDVVMQSATDISFTNVVHTLSRRYTGAGGAGVPASETHFRLPPDCPRYVRAQVTFGASTTTGAAVSATPSLRF